VLFRTPPSLSWRCIRMTFPLFTIEGRWSPLDHSALNYSTPLSPVPVEISLSLDAVDRERSTPAESVIETFLFEHFFPPSPPLRCLPPPPFCNSSLVPFLSFVRPERQYSPRALLLGNPFARAEPAKHQSESFAPPKPVTVHLELFPPPSSPSPIFSRGRAFSPSPTYDVPS